MYHASAAWKWRRSGVSLRPPPIVCYGLVSLTLIALCKRRGRPVDILVSGVEARAKSSGSVHGKTAELRRDSKPATGCRHALTLFRHDRSVAAPCREVGHALHPPSPATAPFPAVELSILYPVEWPKIRCRTRQNALSRAISLAGRPIGGRQSNSAPGELGERTILATACACASVFPLDPEPSSGDLEAGLVYFALGASRVVHWQSQARLCF